MSHVPNPEIEEILARLAALKPSEQLQVMTRFSAGLIDASGTVPDDGAGRVETAEGQAGETTARTPEEREALAGRWTHGGTEDELVASIRAARLPSREVETW